MQHHYTRGRQPGRRLQLKWLLLFLVTFAAYPAMATHFRYGSMTWKRDLSYTGPGYKIDFTVTESWRRGFDWTSYGSQQFNLVGSSTLPDPGEKIRFYNNFPLNFGDGASAQIVLDVTSIIPTDANTNNDIVNGVFLVSHVYQQTATTPVPTNYVAFFEGAARLNNGTGPTLMLNNGGGSFRVESRVTTGNNNDAPVSTLPPVVNMIVGLNPATYQIPATDPNGDSITYSLAPSASFTQTGQTALTQPFQTTPGRFTVSPGGVISFNTVGLTTGAQYNAVIRLTDSRGAYTHLDIIVRIVPTSAAPVFDYSTGQTPANNTTYNVAYGTPVSFNVRATDPNPADAVTLFGIGLPVGASLTPTLPLTGAAGGAAATAFSWTPTASQIGNNVLTFVAQDPQGVQKATSVNVNVSCQVSVSGTVSGATCNGANGSITVSTSGGTGPFTYSKDGGATFGSSNVFNGLAPGSYSVQVKEATGCVVEQNIAVANVADTDPPVIAVFTTPASPVTISQAGRASTWTNIKLNGAGNVLAVNPGAPVVLTGSWSSAYDGGGGCANCITQHYLGLGSTTITCRSINPNGSPATGSSATVYDAFTAPTAPGVYYITQEGNWCFFCGQCTPGSYNTAPANAVAVLIVRTPTCHVDVTVNNATGTCGAPVNYVTPSVWDNCPGATITQTVGQANNSVFAVGTTPNSFTAADASNNYAVCSFNVIVIDNEPPTITAPANVTVNTDGGLCSASGVSLGTATTADNCSVATVTNDAPAVFPKGTTTVTWTVTDIHNNTATATQTVTVEDHQNPIIAAPITVNANADLGQCYATIPNLGFPTFIDNCPGSSYTSTAAANNRYNVGVTLVGYTVTDASGNQATAFQAVVVTDTQNPTITAPGNVTVGTDAGLCAATGVNLGTPVTADNCGVGQVVNDAPASFPKGVTTVTWTVRDVHGNEATATQAVTVEDRQNPTITAPANVVTNTSADGTGNCTTKASLGTPASADNCGAVTVSAKVGGMTINPATYNFPIGTTTVTWTATDGSGNTASADQTVSVTDNELPVIACPANVAQCDNTSGNTVTLNLGASDNCAIATISYAITGATTASGTGGMISRSFNVGTSTVTWTVKDASNNTSTCSMTVLIRALPTASITASTADEFCNATTLTANITPAGTATYAWSYNNASFATTQSIKLQLANADGMYRVVVTDMYGCSSAPASYNFQKQNLVNMYVLLGTKEVDLAQSNDVIGGSVGVTSSHGEAEFDKYCTVASPGAFVKAVDIDTKSPVTIPTKIYSQAVVTLPTMYVNSSSTSSLSNYVMTTNGTVTGNKKDLTIASGKTVTITGTVFRNIRIMHNAEVTFTASDISIESLDVDYGSTLHFTSNTKLRVSDEVSIDKECSINPEAKRVTFYVKDPSANSYNCWGNWSSWHSWSNGSSEKFTVDGKGTNIIANVYMPDGKLRVHGNGWSCSWNQSESCNMMGLFIAEEIEGDGKNINWYSYDCAAPASFRQVAHTAPLDEAVDYQVLMYPNPTTGQFTLQFGNTAEAAQVRITDIQGRLISSRTIAVSEMPSASFSLEREVPGVYMVEIQQGGSIVRNRIVRQ